MGEEMSENEMARALAANGWKRKKSVDYGSTWFWISSNGQGKPTTEIAYGYLMSIKGRRAHG